MTLKQFEKELRKDFLEKYTKKVTDLSFKYFVTAKPLSSKINEK